jgi:hypothetical protein
MPTLMNERLCKMLIAAFYRRVRQGDKPVVALRALLNEVYAQGVTAGQQRVQ